ncbi:hypothetical protein GCM10008983_16610 [Lentibacillus halophilus]|uniref:Uncharacterized protein n=1 Tax=Lentibacillus halophilus TaxID=295065 RepID=A0ABP3J3E5_9BACI
MAVIILTIDDTFTWYWLIYPLIKQLKYLFNTQGRIYWYDSFKIEEVLQTLYRRQMAGGKG